MRYDCDVEAAVAPFAHYGISATRGLVVFFGSVAD